MTTSIVGVHKRSLLPLYIPSLLMGIPAQASLVLLPLYVLELGSGPALAAMVVGFRGLGMMTAGIPAGLFVARVGEKRLMILASISLAVVFFSYAILESIVWFALMAFVHGCASSAFLLARLTYLSGNISGSERGRVIAVIGTSMRASALIGPALAGFIAVKFSFAVAFFSGGFLFLFGSFLILIYMRKNASQSKMVSIKSLCVLVREKCNVLATVGIVAVSFMFLRSARNLLLPLCGAGLGLGPEIVGTLVSFSAGVDMLFAYPAGILMDRYGRRATAIPSSLLFCLTFVLISIANSSTGMLLAACMAGLANGLSTGIVMILGTDHAPADARGEFLGLWRLLTDVGTTTSPILISTMLTFATLSFVSVFVALIGLGGTLIVHRSVSETQNITETR